jgi:hypothetical protein
MKRQEAMFARWPRREGVGFGDDAGGEDTHVGSHVAFSN